MKITVCVFAATCLLNALTAADLSAFDTNLGAENFESNFLNFVGKEDDGAKEQLPNLNFPPRRPTTVSTTRGTTTLEPSSTEIPTAPPTTTSTPRPVPPSSSPRPTTTRKPRPPPSSPRPTTTRKPLPPPPSSPPLRNPQIYDNTVEALGPFAGHLVNLVLNQGERQRTVQKNHILYNVKSTGSNE